jgi:hypothetical protein
MLETSLAPADEAIFDLDTDKFLALLRHLFQLWTISNRSYNFTLAEPPSPDAPRALDMSKSIVDAGWVAPLYYVVVKCRVHRVRVQALRLLETTNHREGIWDAVTAARVARKVVQIEENGLYGAGVAGDGFPLTSWPTERDLAMRVPLDRRVRDVKVELVGAPLRVVRLSCARQGGGRSFLALEYDIRRRTWTKPAATS